MRDIGIIESFFERFGAGRPTGGAAPAVGRFVVALSVLAGGGCEGDGLDVDFDRLTTIPEVHEIDFSAVTPAAAWDYWELRFHVPSTFDSVVGAGGAFARAMLPPAVLTTLDGLELQFGFAFECLPGACFKFIAAVAGDSVVVFDTTQELEAFLGPFDDVAEAVIAMDAAGYHWGTEDDGTGFRPLDDGWEFVALQLVRDCAPIQTDRVLVRVTTAGTLRVIDREVFRRDENACI